jgi:hypothetical protein
VEHNRIVRECGGIVREASDLDTAGCVTKCLLQSHLVSGPHTFCLVFHSDMIGKEP